MAEDLQTLEEAISTQLAAIEIDLVDVELRQGTLCVTVTRPDGLDLESLTLASRAVNDFLDAHEELTPDEPFELEVSSPGLERRLRKPEHYLKALGQMIAIRTTSSTPGARRDEGVLVRADESGIVLDSQNSHETRELTYGSIDRAHTVFDWKAALAAEKHDRTHAGEDSERSQQGPKRQHNRKASEPSRENQR